jgi:hypothetical protein
VKLISIILLLISFNVWSKVDLNLILTVEKAKQGEIVQGKIVLGSSEGQVALSGLNGLNVQKTIYLISVSPFVGKDGNYEADAKVIFLKIPEALSLQETVNGEEINIRWTAVEIIPTEEPQSFLLGNFEVPSRISFTRWIIGGAGSLVIIFLVFFLIRWRKKKQKVKAAKTKLKKDLLNNETYTDIVTMWRQKQVFLEAFPVISEDFKEFEKVLFKYQFKQTQNNSELEEIVSAYKTFCSKIQGSLDGV